MNNNILETTYQGQGSDIQIQWAKSLFDSEMAAIKKDYELAKDRVARGTMPQSWLDAWNEVLAYDNVTSAITKLAVKPAGAMIDDKGGIRLKTGKIFISAIVNKMAVAAYQKKQAQ